MFEKKLNPAILGKVSKNLLREFKNRSRMSEAQYATAVEEYNAEVDRRRASSIRSKKLNDVLPMFIEEANDIIPMRKIQERARALEGRQNKNENKKNKVIIDLKHKKIDIEDIEGDDKWEKIKDKLIESAKKLVGKKMVYIQSSKDGEIFRSSLVIIKSKNYTTIFWDSILPFIQEYVDGEVTNIFYDCDSYARIAIFDSETLVPEQITQKYLDGDKHCVIEPLRLTFLEYANNCTTKDSQRKMNAVVKKLTELEKQYVYGVPEDDMEIVAKAVSRCIVIHNLIGNEIKKYNSKSSKYFHFTNTRNNHLDYGFLTITGKYELISQEEMNVILFDHDKKKEFYLFDGDVDGKQARVLSSARGNWRVVNEDYEIYKEFDESIGKKNYGLNSIEYNELNDFIKESRIINATPVPLCDEPNNLSDIHHIDISKAYTQHKHCEFYQGFLGHIHSYSKLDNITNSLEFLETHLGIYQVKITKNNNKLINQLGIFEGKKYTLPSVEIIAFIKKYGVEVKLIAGCWGSSFDIEYTDELLENRRYAIWAGKLGQDNEFDKYTFSGNKEWAKHLKYELGNENVYYFNDWNMITIKIDKKTNFTYHHILAFITSYTRLNMLDIMSKIDGELVKVILDGIYYRGIINDVVIPHHKDKEIKTHLGFREHWYYPTMINTTNWAKYNNNFDGNCILSGAGGTGKTYSVYNYKGLIKPLYVVPSHILGKKMRDIYNCDYTTIQRLAGIDCISYKEMYKEPHTILIDELTMTNKSFIEKVIQMYPTSLLLLAGDIDKNQWYQCRNGDNGNFNEIFMPTDWKYVNYTIDRRSKDDNIKNLKQQIRNKMVDIFETGGMGEAKMLNDYIYENCEVMDFKDAVNKFQTGDIWLAGTHRTNKKLIDNNIISGWINAKKEINFNCEGDKRGSFTIHSYQGLTIEKETVFISLDLFEYAMLYTAVSRCCYLKQIVFVKDSN